MVIITREFSPESDTGIIRDTMPKSIYYDTHPRRGRPSQKWFQEFDAYLMELLQDAKIIIATTDDNQDFIIGYAIFHSDQLEFVYVKEAYRKNGVGTMLSSQVAYFKINQKNMTKLGQQIINQKQKAMEEILSSLEQVETKTTKAPTKSEETHISKSDEKKIQALIDAGFEIKKVNFQSAILSGFNGAENELNCGSTHVQRRPTKMWWTMAGVIIDQNNHRFIVPHANTVKGEIY